MLRDPEEQLMALLKGAVIREAARLATAIVYGEVSVERVRRLAEESGDAEPRLAVLIFDFFPDTAGFEIDG